MASEESTAQQVETQDPQFLQRVGSLPIVTAAINQLSNIYKTTKESNKYVKYTLETAEEGVKKVAGSAVPVVTRLEKPTHAICDSCLLTVGALDSLACSQLDKLEEKCPLITKPTEEVVEETKKVYDSTLKPHVDRAVAAKDTTIGKVSAATQYAADTVTAVKDYGVNTAGAVKDYGVNTAGAVKDYGATKVSDATTYTYEKVGAAATYSGKKLGEVLDTPTGKTIVSKVDQILDTTEQYVDYYLAEDKPEGAESVETEGEEKEEGSMLDPDPEPKTTATRFVSVGDKVRRRIYAKSMRELQNIQRRSKETLDRLNFTVDLIEYARVNLDEAKGKVSAAQTKFLAVWEEINKEERTEIEMDDLGANSTGAAEEPEKEAAQIQKVTLERRAIATARHLTNQLKRGFTTMTSTFTVLPAGLQTRITNAKNFTESLYTNFANAKTLQDIPQTVVTQTREQVSHLQDTISSYSDYLRNSYFGSWLGAKEDLKEDSSTETEDKDTKERVDDVDETGEKLESATVDDQKDTPAEGC